jgi:SAM-dependent methyltransferase
MTIKSLDAVNLDMLETEYVHCDLCGSTYSVEIFHGRDYRLGYQGRFRFVRCAECGLLYLNPRPTVAAIRRLYESHYADLQLEPDPPQNNGFLRSARQLWHRLNANYTEEIVARARGRILDVGCGPGKFLVKLRAKGLEVWGQELNRSLRPLHERLGLNVYYGPLRELGLPEDSFDTIILSQVLEHLPEPTAEMSEIRLLLRPGGTVLIYSPNGNGYLRTLFGRFWHGWHIPFHFHLMTPHTMPRLAAAVGLEVTRLETATPDDFLTTSLHAFLSGRGRFLKGLVDSTVLRGLTAPELRLLDRILPNRGDCLKVELTRKE